MTKSCSTCVYYQMQDHESGHCHRYPPTLTRTIPQHHWCGEWAAAGSTANEPVEEPEVCGQCHFLLIQPGAQFGFCTAYSSRVRRYIHYAACEKFRDKTIPETCGCCINYQPIGGFYENECGVCIIEGSTVTHETISKGYKKSVVCFRQRLPTDSCDKFKRNPSPKEC